jgi:hypothetical protein
MVLESIWATKTETASRLRGRIKAVLNWATARNHHQGENPARWCGHLENLLPPRGRVRRVRHHAALPYAEVAGFMAALEVLGRPPTCAPGTSCSRAAGRTGRCRIWRCSSC